MVGMKRTVFLLIVAIIIGLGFDAQAQTITNASHSTVAHVKSDGTIQDSGYHTIGHFKSDGTVQDAGYHTIGHINSDGTIQDASYHTIGHASGVPAKWAAYLFFFLY